MLGRLAIAASGGETAEPADRMTQREARRECVTGAERGHVMSPHIPGGSHKGREQPSGENSARLQRVDAEDFAQVSGVVTPLVNDVKNLRAHDAAKNHENPEIPGVVAVISEALGIADADPEA